MIRANMSEHFPLIAAVIDEEGDYVSNEVVTYDIRYIDDTPLSPPINGILIESTVSSGIYKSNVSINTHGSFICYVTCSGYPTSAEDIVINPENIYDITKRNSNYNLSVENVNRTNATPTSSQAARNVPLGKTDYIINYIKDDNAVDWSSPVSSGVVYAHYKTVNDSAPYKMAGPN